MRAICLGLKRQILNGACGIGNRSHRFTCGVLVFVLFLMFASGSEATTRWAAAYGGTKSEFFKSLQQTKGGSYVFAGSTRSFGAAGEEWNDGWVVKLDKYGRVSWSKRFGGTEWKDWDGFSSIRQTVDGGYIVAGETWSFGAGSSDAWVIKLNASGDITWQKTYGGTGGDQADCIRQTADNGYIVAGSTRSFGTNKDIWVFKLTSSGTIVWQKTYGGTDGEEDALVEQTSDGGYIVAARTWSFGAGYVDILFLKLDANGIVEWRRTYGGSGWDEANTIRQTSDNGYIIAGTTGSFGVGRDNVWLIRLDQYGSLLWQKTYGGDDSYESSYGNYLDITRDGNFIVAGYTESFGAGWSDIWVLKINTSGQVLWEKRYGTAAGSDPAYFIQQTFDGGYMIAGQNDLFGDQLDIYLYKLDENGDLPPCISGFETHTTNAVVFTPSLPWIFFKPLNVQDTTATVNNSNAVVNNTTPTVQPLCPYDGHFNDHLPPIFLMLLGE